VKLLVIGHARHGKDTVCEELVNRLSYSYVSSSLWAAHRFIFYRFQREFPGKYPNPYAAWLDRDNHRPLWHDWIREYNDPDLARMAGEIWSEHHIYCGLRNLEEYLAIKAKLKPTHIVWVDARSRLPLEPVSSFQLEPVHATYYFDNNGSLDDFEQEFELMVRTLKLPMYS
jgi:hypothetical protein